MAIRFSQDEKDTMNRAYIMAGRNKPSKAVRQEIADKLGFPLDKINEYFKYLSKKSKKAQVTSDGFKHHPLSSSYANVLEAHVTSDGFKHHPLSSSYANVLESPSPSQKAMVSSQTLPPIPESKDTEPPPEHKEDDPPAADLESKGNAL
ncbi:hypothetical protein RSAG8_04631, partial [Rhizoctonia solani AG-8 WAC10335]